MSDMESVEVRLVEERLLDLVEDASLRGELVHLQHVPDLYAKNYGEALDAARRKALGCKGLKGFLEKIPGITLRGKQNSTTVHVAATCEGESQRRLRRDDDEAREQQQHAALGRPKFGFEEGDDDSVCNGASPVAHGAGAASGSDGARALSNGAAPVLTPDAIRQQRQNAKAEMLALDPSFTRPARRRSKATGSQATTVMGKMQATVVESATRSDALAYFDELDSDRRAHSGEGDEQAEALVAPVISPGFGCEIAGAVAGFLHTPTRRAAHSNNVRAPLLDWGAACSASGPREFGLFGNVLEDDVRAEAALGALGRGPLGALDLESRSTGRAVALNVSEPFCLVAVGVQVWQGCGGVVAVPPPPAVACHYELCLHGCAQLCLHVCVRA